MNKSMFNANDYQVKVATPVGEAMWASLKEPKKWQPGDAGNYQMSLVVSKSEAEPLISQCMAVRTKMEDMMQKDGKTVKLSPHDPWKETDDGKIEFRFKKPHFDANDKYPASKPVPTYLPDGSKVDWENTDWAVGNGSTVQVGGFIRPYYVGTLGLGISLRLAAVKVVELKKFVAGSSDDFGFGSSETTSDGSPEEFSSADF
jgi:hypothetical protein